MWYKNIAGRFFGLVTKHACDRRTDRITTPQDRASIAASRGEKLTLTQANLPLNKKMPKPHKT